MNKLIKFFDISTLNKRDRLLFVCAFIGGTNIGPIIANGSGHPLWVNFTALCIGLAWVIMKDE